MKVLRENTTFLLPLSQCDTPHLGLGKWKFANFSEKLHICEVDGKHDRISNFH